MSAPIAHTVTVIISDGLRERTLSTDADRRADVAAVASGLAERAARALAEERTADEERRLMHGGEALRESALAAAIAADLRAAGSRWADLEARAAELGLELAPHRSHHRRSEVARMTAALAAPRVLAGDLTLGGRVDRYLRRRIDREIERRIGPATPAEDAAYRVRLSAICPAPRERL